MALEDKIGQKTVMESPLLELPSAELLVVCLISLGSLQVRQMRDIVATILYTIFVYFDIRFSQKVKTGMSLASL